jgi:pilus assembly protein CpaF
MLIAGSLDFVVFLRKRNDYATGGRLARTIESVREVTGIDGRVLSSEVFAAGPHGVALAHAPIACIDDLEAAGYESRVHGRWRE